MAVTAGEIIVLACLGLLLYGWVLYPFLIRLLPPRRTPALLDMPRSPASPVAVLLAAHNEERVINARLENLIAALRPVGMEGRRVLVFVGIDGSTDRTGAVAREVAARHDSVRVFEFDQRRGKVAVLKALVKRADAVFADETTGDERDPVFVFTDANTFFRPDALEKLLIRLRDSRVGGVCGRLILHSQGSDVSESAYWNWEARLKKAESDADSCLGANGAIYAIRGRLFWRAIPDNTVVDDFVIGMKVREQGHRFIFEPAAVAEENLPETRHEWRRRVRIGSGDYQSLVLCRRCLLPRYGCFAWVFWSHKVLRWFTPHLLILLAGAVAWAWLRGPRWPRLILGTGAAMAVALIVALMGGGMGDSQTVLARLARACRHFVIMQAALFVGFLRFCRGDLKGHWVRTPRGE